MSTCDHTFVAGPFFLMAANTLEEPTYYPPQAFMPVEHCFKCGALRLSENARRHVGPNLRSNLFPPKESEEKTG